MALNTLNVNAPADSDYVKDGAGEIRGIKADLLSELSPINANLTPEVSTDLLNELVEGVVPNTSVGGIAFPSTGLDKTNITLDGQVSFQPAGILFNNNSEIVNNDGKFLTQEAMEDLFSANSTAIQDLSDKADSEFTALEAQVDALVSTGSSATKNVDFITSTLASISNDLVTIQAQDLSNVVVDNAFSVGDFHISADSTNPATRFGGTWVQIDPDTGLVSVTSNAPSAAANGGEGIVGKNVMPAEVPEHTHDATVTFNPLPPHFHQTPYYDYGGGSQVAQDIGPGKLFDKSDAASGGKPAGTFVITNTGTPNASIDVRGTRIAVYFWKKIAN